MSIRTEIDRAIRTGKDIEIVYVKYDGTRSRRRVSNISYCNDYEDYGYENDHISGFCHLRGEDRHFKIDRIQSIRVLPDGPIVNNPKKLDAVNTYSSFSSGSYSRVATPPRYSSTPSTRSYSSSSSKKSSEGCYIATMVYGDYDHPKVMILRQYRDEYLLKSFWGRCFVRVYYYLSPKAVRILHDKKRINDRIRSRLDKLVSNTNFTKKLRGDMKI
jgi:hypothetical protein